MHLSSYYLQPKQTNPAAHLRTMLALIPLHWLARSWHCSLLAAWPWEIYLVTFSAICNMETFMLSPSQSWDKHSINNNTCRVLRTVLKRVFKYLLCEESSTPFHQMPETPTQISLIWIVCKHFKIRVFDIKSAFIISLEKSETLATLGLLHSHMAMLCWKSRTATFK